MFSPEEKQEILRLTTKIVSAYGSKKTVALSDLPGLIANVHQALATVGAEQEAPKLKPAVPIEKSVSGSYIVCLEDGKQRKVLKSHLRIAHNLTPAEYRERWGLPADYPVVAPDYAAARSQMAKKIGLGTEKTGRPKRGRKSRK